MAVLMIVNHWNALESTDTTVLGKGKLIESHSQTQAGDELVVFNVLRKHFELLAVIGAFQSLPPGMTRGLDALLETAGAVFSIGYGSADSIQCFLADLGASDRSADSLSGIPATRSEAFLTVAIWLGLVATLALWAFAVQLAIRVTSWQCMRSCLGDATVDAIIDTAPVKALSGMLGVDTIPTSDKSDSAAALKDRRKPGHPTQENLKSGSGPSQIMPVPAVDPATSQLDS